MGPAFRYHVVTVFGILSALAIGMLIGSSFLSGIVVDKLSKQVKDLRYDYNNRVAALSEANRQYANFVTAIGPIIVANRLSGSRIALVQTGDYPEATAKVRDALQQAGATVTSTTVIERAFPDRSQLVLSAILPKLTPSHPNLPQDATGVMTVLAEALAKGGRDTELAMLADARLIRTDGDYSLPSDHVVLIGGAAMEDDGRADTVDIPLIAQLKLAKVNVIEVEPAQAGASYVAALRQSDVTTVDNVDTDIGRISVVLALRADRGSYGIKSASQSGLLPPASTDDFRRHSGL